MDIITPCRRTISERFPILSFIVRVPEARHFEIACTTDPRLFHTDYSNSRTPHNFYTTRSEGLIPANRGDNTWIMPPQQLKRFVGASKIYYALGTYAGRKGENPRFTIAPDVLPHVPHIQLSPDLTGRSLDRGRFGHRSESTATYGGHARHLMRWGGDIALEEERQTSKLNESVQPHYGRIPYDDGFDPSLWGSHRESDTAIDRDYFDDGDNNMPNQNQPNNYRQGMEYGNMPNTYRSQNDYWNNNPNYGRATYPYNFKQRYTSASNTNEEQLIRDLVNRTGANENQIRSFIEQLKGPAVNAQGKSLSHAMSDSGPTIHLPGGHVLEGWQAEAFIGLLRLALTGNPAAALLAPIFPDAILMACENLNITLGIGPTVAGGTGTSGASLGVGILFAPGNRIGFYGSASGIEGWIASVSAGIQVTVIHGGPEKFGGYAIAMGGVVDLSEGPGIGVSVLTSTDGRLLGVSGEVSLSLGVPLLSAIEAFAQFQITGTTLSAQQLSALPNRGYTGQPGNANYGRVGNAYAPRRYASGQSAEEERLIQDLVSHSGVDENQIRSFIDQLKGPAGRAQSRSLSRAMSNNGPTIHLPGGQILEGWQADAFIGLLRLTLSTNPATALLSAIFPDAIFMACNNLNITLGIGPTVAGGLGGGGALGAGILFAPGNRIGFYGSRSGIAGWIASLSAGIQITVVHGGPEHFGGDAIAMGAVVDTSEGPGIGVHVLTTPDGNFLGVTGEVSFSIGIPLLTAVEVFAQYQRTDTTLSVHQLAALANGNNVNNINGNELEDGAAFYQRANPPATNHPAQNNNGLPCDNEQNELQTPSLAYGRPTRNTHGMPGHGQAVRYGRPGKQSAYCENNIEENLPVGPSSRPLSSPSQPARVLDIPEKVRILRVVAKGESGDDAYASVNADTEYNTPGHDAYQRQHIGLSWGIVHFTQRSGMLGKVLKKAKERELALMPPISPEGSLPAEQRFEALFGEHWQQLLNTTDPEITTSPDDRVAPVGDVPLWQEPWLSRFRNAGSVPYIQAAQNEIAVTEYFNTVQRVADWLGLRTARGLAMLLDRVIHAGIGGGLSWIMANIGPIRSESDRRAALQAVIGHPDDLTSFQQQQGIEASGEWNAMTHAALMGALRTMGEQSPIPIPSSDSLLRTLLVAAQGTDFEQRLQTLYNNTEDFDDNVTYQLA